MIETKYTRNERYTERTKHAHGVNDTRSEHEKNATLNSPLAVPLNSLAVHLHLTPDLLSQWGTEVSLVD